MPITIDGSNGITQAGEFNSDSTFGFKNRIINGAMVIDQRNAGASVTPASGAYTLDRWYFSLSQASKLTCQQNAGAVTPPVGFTNYLGVTSSSAYTVGSTEVFLLRQNIEGFNVADLGWGTANAKTVTLSFWVRSSLTGTFGGSFRNAAGNRFYPYSYTISAANTWEYKTVTIAGDTTGTWATNNTSGIELFFSLGSGSTVSGTAGSWGATAYYSTTGATSVVGTNGATFYITGVQLEVGSTATSFDYRPYGTELALCQRYYAKMNAGTGAYTGFGSGVAGATTTAYIFFKYPVTMRSSPTISSTSCGVQDGNSIFAVTISTTYAGQDTAFQAFTATGLTQFRPYVLTANNSTSAFVDFSSEL
jgi:hypothetical protein